jgi:hypothetical protein
MSTRRAACSCGQLHLTIEGEPSRISMCHCLECQRRTGAVISNQARFRREQVTFAGKSAASPLPSAASPTRTSPRRPSVCGRSHATPGSPYRLTRRPSAWQSRGDKTTAASRPLLHQQRREGGHSGTSICAMSCREQVQQMARLFDHPFQSAVSTF